MNHYETAINDLIEHIKADKAITQPWRNKAIARMEEATAFVRMGLTTTYRESPNMVIGSAIECGCAFGVVDNGCPIHGLPSRLRKPAE